MDYREYKDLAPRSDIENGQEYINALEWAFGNSKIKNIALAGPYGAGKSSIIDTYLKYDQEKNHSTGRPKSSKSLSGTSLKISMATFVEEQTETGGKIKIGADEVEQGILKQLFYKVEHRRIPQSRYRKLHVENIKKVFGKAFTAIVLLAILMAVFVPQALAFVWGRVGSFVDACQMPEWGSYILLALLCILTACIVSHLWCLASNRYHLKEITLPADAKIEADSNFSDSVFNKNLDEIMYFFEATPYRTVFFEDLDRLDDRKIFVHLRELNNLLNNDDAIKEKPIVFIYAVKDDIFTKEDRTKFFDFIIPVIPVINSTNSGETVLERLEESRANGVEHKISQAFVLDVAPYISDMRVLQNIYNEFVLYKNTLKVSQELPLSDEQMMAMIIFKNLYPSDFADIQAEKGIIKKAFENKTSYIQEEKYRLQTEIDSFSQVITNAEHDHLKSVRELKAAMLAGMTNNDGFATRFSGYGYNDVYAYNVMDDSFDMHQFAEKEFSTVRYISFTGNNTSKSIDNFKEKIAPYVERWDYLNTLEKDGLEKLQDELEDLKQKQHSLSGKSIANVISDCKDFTFEKDVSDNKFLVFLLRRGYIDEKYATYINYFKGNSITTADMKFILSVKNKEPEVFDYHLTKTAMVVQRLQDYEFEQKEIYNFDLMEQLLADENERTKREIFIQQLADESEASWSFIDEFVDRTKNQKKFIRLLSSVWPGMWEYISGISTLQYERQLYYLSLLIDTLDESAIEKLNENNAIKNYMEDHEDILQKLSSSTSGKALCAALEKLNVSFGIQETDGVPDCVLDYVFDHCLYQLNEKMIFNLVSYKNDAMISNLETQPYTTIIGLGYNELTDYVHENPALYITNNILVKKSLEDREDLIIDMLLRVFSDHEICVKVIEVEQFQVHDITQLLESDDENNSEDVKVIWDALLYNNKMDPTWENIMHYWECFHFNNNDKVLTEYITQHTEELKMIDTGCCTDKFIQAFIAADLGPNVYERLLPVLHMNDFNLDLETLTENMIGLMIEIKYFDFTVTRYTYLDEEYHHLAINYIAKNQEEFLDQVEEITMSADLLNELLSNGSIDDTTKKQLFDLFAEKYMSVDIVNHVVSGRFKIKKSCFEAAWQYANISQKERMFIENLELLNIDDLEQCFSDLGDKYSNFKRSPYRHEAELLESEESLKLARHLRKVEYITSYEPIDRERYDTRLHRTQTVKVIKYRIKQKK